MSRRDAIACLVWAALPISGIVLGQPVEDAAELLRKAQFMAERTNTWKAEVVERSHISGDGLNLNSEVRTKIAVQAPLRMSRRNSGADQTTLVCDGAEAFYSGDGHSYYRTEAKINPDCNLPLSRFYKLENNPTEAAIVGRDHVRLGSEDRECVSVRATWRNGTVKTVRTMCIDPVSALILRDVAESYEEKAGVRMVKTTLFTSYEGNPAFPRDAFRFSLPPGAVEVNPPI